MLSAGCNHARAEVMQPILHQAVHQQWYWLQLFACYDHGRPEDRIMVSMYLVRRQQYQVEPESRSRMVVQGYLGPEVEDMT